MSKDFLAQEISKKLIQDTLGPQWKEIAEINLRLIMNTGSLATIHFENCETFSRQIFHVQRRIRYHLPDLTKIGNKTLSDKDYSILLKTIGLYPALIQQRDFFICLEELRIEADMKIVRDFIGVLLSTAYPQILPPFSTEARSVEDLATEQHLQLVDVSKEGESYSGNIVGIDNYKILINYARLKAFILYFWDLPSSQTIPAKNDTVFIQFNDEKVTELKFINKS